MPCRLMTQYSKRLMITVLTTCRCTLKFSQRMLRRLENIDNATCAGPPAQARAALASSVVAHAVVEPEIQVIELK